MKILFISYSFYPVVGGIPYISEYLAKYLNKKNNEIILLTSAKLSKKQKENFNYKIFCNPDKRKILELHDWADIVFHNHISLRLCSFKIKHTKKTVVTLQYWLTKRKIVQKAITKLKVLFLKLCAQRIFISKSIKRYYLLKGKIIGNFYNEKIFYDNISFNKRKKKIIFVGRATPEKGLDILLKSIHQISYMFKEKEITVIGDGPNLKEYINLSKKLKIYKYINFLGAIKNENIGKYYNQHKIHVVPSLNEPFGIVALEGNACGCVSIVADNAGLGELDRNNYQFFKSKNYLELSKILKKNILNGKPLKKSKRDLILSKNSLNDIGAKYIQVFQEIIKKNNV